jgi:anti-sigma-K factor RskA
MAETVDIHALAGAYVLDAVDDLERAAFDRHLRDCATCAIEVAELRETATWLSHPEAVTPPPGLRDAVLAAIANTPQERPRGTAPVRSIGSAKPVTPPAPSRWRRWAVSAVAASVLAAGAGVGTWVVTEQGVREQNAKIDAVLAASDAKLVQGEMAGGRVTLIVSQSRDAAVAVAEGMRRPGADKVYQLWMLGGTTAKPADKGTLDVNSGDGRVYMANLGGAAQFAISVEPKGGSAQPSRDALAGKPLEF